MLWIFLTLITTVCGKIELDLENGDLREILASVVRELNTKDENIAALENEVKHLRNRVNALETRDNDFIEKNSAKQNQGRTDHRMTQRDSATHEVLPRQAINEQPVAFYAYLSKHALNLGPHQNIIFDVVDTNVANAYHNTLGSFIAPEHGMYVFSVTIMSYPGNTAHYGIQKSGTLVGLLYPSGNSASSYETASQTIVIEVKVGEDIEVQNLDPNENIHGGRYTSFSGFLLYQIEDSVAIGRK